MDEHRRHVDAVAAEQADVGAFQRRRGSEPCSEAQPDRVVLARVGIADRVDFGGVDRLARIGGQRIGQREFRGAGLRIGASSGRIRKLRRKSSVTVRRPSLPVRSSR